MIATVLFVSCISVASAESLGLRRQATAKKEAVDDASAGSVVVASVVIDNVDNIEGDERRNLQSHPQPPPAPTPWCNVAGVSPPARYHPVYSVGWDFGYCELNSDCNTPGYDTQLECCNAVYKFQTSGTCVQGLPNPPTRSPTSVPTKSPRTADFWYADYETTWEEAGCRNTLPLPYRNVNDRPNYPTQLECCNEAYASQPSGACLGGLPNPPTKSPTSVPTESPNPPTKPPTGITTTESPIAPFAAGVPNRPTKYPIRAPTKSLGALLPSGTNNDLKYTGSKAAKASGRRTNKDENSSTPRLP